MTLLWIVLFGCGDADLRPGPEIAEAELRTQVEGVLR